MGGLWGWFSNVFSFLFGTIVLGGGFASRVPLRVHVCGWAHLVLYGRLWLYGSEAWCLTANDEKNLCIWERKVLRNIFVPICVAGYWRSRTNEEARQLYGELDIVTGIKKED